MSDKAPFTMLGLDHVVLRIRDLEKMRAFYMDVLGCTFEDHDTDLGLFQVRAGKQLIDLIPVDEPAGSSSSHNMDHFAIQIEPYDDEAIRDYLSAHGVELGETRIRGGAEGEGPAIYIKDPEGNTVELKGPADPAYDVFAGQPFEAARDSVA
ncbi:MAG: VOC family protein [Alphaproteobacteria bacterium]|nr:VOC family protein [Alphaproteobacteria bacterium]